MKLLGRFEQFLSDFTQKDVRGGEELFPRSKTKICMTVQDLYDMHTPLTL